MWLHMWMYDVSESLSHEEMFEMSANDMSGLPASGSRWWSLVSRLSRPSRRSTARTEYDLAVDLKSRTLPRELACHGQSEGRGGLREGRVRGERC
jgi:hypothetical protein